MKCEISNVYINYNNIKKLQEVIRNFQWKKYFML